MSTALRMTARSLRVALGDPDFKAAMDKLETPTAFKQGEEFRRFFDADARRQAEGVRKVGKVEPEWRGRVPPTPGEVSPG